MANLNTWFQKHDLCAGNILYIYRNDHKTVICRTDGEEFSLFAPVHDVLSVLPEGEFLNISKGTVVCRSHIVNISNDGVYTMSDGRTFQGRKRGLSSHRRLRTEIGLTDTQPLPLNMLEKCTLISVVCPVGTPDAQLQAYRKIIDLADVVLYVHDADMSATDSGENRAFAFAVESHTPTLVLHPKELTAKWVGE